MDNEQPALSGNEQLRHECLRDGEEALLHKIAEPIALQHPEMTIVEIFDLVRAKEPKTQDETDALAIIDRMIAEFHCIAKRFPK